MDKHESASLLVQKVTMADFGDFFLQLKNQKEGIFCSVCGSNNWDIHNNPEDQGKPVVVTLPIPDKDGMGVWCFYLACSNCGGMKLINANKVAKWVENKRK